MQYKKKNFKVWMQCSIKRKTCRNQRKHGGVE